MELKPLTPPRFSVADILEKYYYQIYKKIQIEPCWRIKETIFGAIRRAMCFKYGVWTTKDVPPEKRKTLQTKRGGKQNENI